MPHVASVPFAIVVGATLLPLALRAQTESLAARSFTPPMSVSRVQTRPDVEALRPPLGFTKEQLVRGDRVFHGELAGGRCSRCHGWDARGTAVGNDLTTGMYIWADGSVNGIKRVLMHNMSVAPGMDGELMPADVDAVAAYVWALGRQADQ